MRRHFLFGAMALGLAIGVSADAASTAPVRPRRIVSVNLCADQLLLALADRGQIAGLTRNAADPAMSAEAARARGLPILRTSAEQILALDPDLIVGTPAYGSAAVLRFTGKRPIVDLPSAATYADIVRQVRAMARAVGHPERGEALVRRMDADLAAIRPVGRGKVAVYYQRRGYVTGTGTLVDDLMTRVGLVNLARRIDRPMLAQLSLEEMVAARPDYLIVEQATERVTDQGTEMLHHPALRGIPRIVVPEAWTVCGGPAYVAAARSMAEQVARHRL